MQAHRHAPQVLDEVEDLLALLITDGVAEQPPKQPDVVSQRLVLVRGRGHDISFRKLPSVGYVPLTHDVRPRLPSAPRREAHFRDGHHTGAAGEFLT